MKKVSVGLLVGACAASLGVGFILGIGATAAGRRFLADIVEQERPADVRQPLSISRDRFSLQYPSNWKIDETDKDYDPDHMFSVESPGSTFVMFLIGNEAGNPETSLDAQIAAFTRLMGKPSVSRFDRLGRFTGVGAVLKGRILAVATTVKVFVFSAEGLTVIIVQNCPDDDLRDVSEGLDLIEKSFTLKPAPE